MHFRVPALVCLAISSNMSFAQSPARYGVLIDELLIDPSPVIGLPNSEFIELKNVSSTSFNVRNWKLSDGNSTATISNNFILQPDSFVIICPNSAVAAFGSFGKTIGVAGFPSLNNDADIITLLSPEGVLIHAVSYSLDWYQNAVKSDGGWTLEMIDTHNPCSGINNWKASVHPSGGTPGRRNSVDGINEDDMPPALLRTYSRDSITIIAVFDESLDSIQASYRANYTIDNGIGNPKTVQPAGPLFNEVTLIFSSPLLPRKVYQLTTKNISDCSGNFIGILNEAGAGLSTSPGSSDIAINEILFNPPAGGYDYVELFNRSDKIVDLQQLYIANRNTAGVLANVSQISLKPWLFFPGEYLVITENKKWLMAHYSVKAPMNVIELSSLPSLPDDKGSFVLLDLQGEIIDQLNYDEKWHFALIDIREGVALERISYNSPTNEKTNWTSAATTVGYGTPTSQNSQFRADLQAQGLVTLFPTIFSPDSDGIDDIAIIQYKMTEPGYVANITIFDAGGRPVRNLVKNALLGLKGNFNWDGLDDKLQPLPTGAYLILTELFNLQGKTKKFKNVIILARKF